MIPPIRKLTITLFLILGFGVLANPGIDQEVDRYIAQIERNQYGSARFVAERLAWSGITDPRLFDVIEQKLLAGPTDGSDEEIDNLAWLAKSLALSGDRRYEKTLKQVATHADSKKLRKHADRSLARLAQFEQWNPEIAEGLDQVSSADLENQRILNMLRSDMPELHRQGAKMVFQAAQDGHTPPAPQTDAAKDRLLANMHSDSSGMSKVELDALKWQINALGAVKNQAVYREALEQVASQSTNKDLKKYAKKRLK